MKHRTIHPIPEATASPCEIAKLMRINADILMKEISEHVDKEIKRLKDSIHYVE